MSDPYQLADIHKRQRQQSESGYVDHPEFAQQPLVIHKSLVQDRQQLQPMLDHRQLSALPQHCY